MKRSSVNIDYDVIRYDNKFYTAFQLEVWVNEELVRLDMEEDTFCR